jgi:uncharacterized membrane protein
MNSSELWNTDTAVQRLCRTAIMAAAVFVMTMFPKIPIPLGYANLGEAVIFLISVRFNRREAALASGLGSALTDLLSGYAIWAVPTFIIKSLMACVISWVLGGRTYPRDSVSGRLILLSFLVSSVWAIAGYTLAGAVLYGGLAAGLSSTPGLTMECAVNLVVAFAAGLVLRRTPICRR